MSKRMNFLRSIIESSSSVEGSGSGSQTRDSGYKSEQTVSEEQQPTPVSYGRGRAYAMALHPDDIPIQNLAIRGRGAFLRSLLPNEDEESPAPAVVEPVKPKNPAQAASALTSATSGVGEKKSPNAAAAGSFVLRPTTEAKEPVIRKGTSGQPINLMSNVMQLKCQANRGIFLYTVDFQPNVDSKHTRQRCLDGQQDIVGKVYLFDGNILLLPKPLPLEQTMITTQHPHQGTNVVMTLIFRVQQQMSDNVTIYNKLFRRIMYMLQLTEMGRKHFDPTQARIVPQHKLEIWPGFVTAVNEFEDGLMLNLDVTHRVLMQTTVYSHIKTIAQIEGVQFRDAVVKSLLGSVVLTRYNKRTYRIDDVCFDANPMSTFRYGDRDITYVEYYKQQYGIDIHDHQQPLLLNRTERRVAGQREPEEFIMCLIPEICYLTGLTDTMRRDYKVMRDIATYTRITPNQRILAMQKFCENVNNHEGARNLLASWGLELNSNPKIMSGRVLAHENITSGGGVVGSAGATADFSRQASNNPMLEVVHIRQWMILYTQRDDKVASMFMDCVKRCSRLLGVEVAQPQIEVLPQDGTQLYVQALRNRIRPGTQIVVIIFPTQRDDRYAAVKRILCTEVPIPSQVINARTLSNDKRNRSVVMKIMLQMNCKLGGSLWGVNIPLSNTMICGIDTYHEGKDRSNSVSAFVGSLDASFTHWYSRATVQARKEEFLNALCVSLEKTLQAYQRRNCTLPQKIIIFRDGVGDNQLLMCEQYEIPQLLAACKLLAPDYEPKITFIVVQKRIITRLFSLNHGGEGYTNAPPGTVLDHTVTRRYLYDYFLVAQTVQMGTVTPTHYIVLRDDSQFAPDILQRLSYKLCFMYYNWPGSIRVPACCMYAHKLAYLIGQSVKRMPAESLNDKLYYL